MPLGPLIAALVVAQSSGGYVEPPPSPPPPEAAPGAARPEEPLVPAQPVPGTHGAPPPAPPRSYAAAARLWPRPQLVIALDLATAVGSLPGGTSATDVLGIVFEGEAQLGAKVSRSVFLGGYGAGGVGGSDSAARACKAADPKLVCNSWTGRGGVLGRLDFTPDRPRNAWVSVGFGTQWNAVDMPAPGGGRTQQRSAVGLETRVAAGLDFAASERLPSGGYFVGLSVGRYTRSGLVPADAGGAMPVEGWITLGMRAVLPR